MSLLYLYRFKFAVKLQIILFENAIIGHFAGQFQGSFGLVVGKSTRPSIFRLREHPRPQAQARAALTLALVQAVDLRRNSDAEAWSHKWLAHLWLAHLWLTHQVVSALAFHL